ncbi:unnamed protein product [Blepharisma stoltei]|uniref:Uncharacterized protein n=1 Tax=Blepharisma stoltei TaxID=1481888 RepID=A0AAU9K0A8_9CILI|nr:unnamed protein product [Blepharisma stoltei]
MEVRKCFEPGCELEVEFSCPCTSPDTYSCYLHFGKHCLSSPVRHNFEPVFVQLFEGTKDAVLKFFSKEMSKKDKIKKKLIASFSQDLWTSKSNLSELLERLELESAEIKNCCEKILHIQKISKLEQDPVINLLSLNPEMALEKAKAIIPGSSDSYNNAKSFFEANLEIGERIESLIQEKLEISLENRLLSIEKNNENLRNNKAENFKDAILELKGDFQKITRELENYKQELKLQRENDKNFLDNHIHEMLNRLDERIQINSTAELSKELKGPISELMRGADKANKEIEALKQEIGLQKKNVPLLLNNEVEKFKDAILESKGDFQKIEREIENYKQEVKLQRENDKNFLDNHIHEMLNRFDEHVKINSTAELSKELKGSISELMRGADKVNKEIEALKNGPLLLNNEVEKFKDAILRLDGDFQKIARELENYKQEIKLQRENDKNFLDNHIHEMLNRFDEHAKINSTAELSKELKGPISELMRGADKANKEIEALKQEIGLEKKNVPLLLNNEVEKFKDAILESKGDFQKIEREIENYKQEVKLQRENDKNFLDNHIHEMLDRFDEHVKINSAAELSKELKEPISELMRGADKVNKEIEALKQEIGFQKKNDPLLLKIDKKVGEYDKIINSLNNDLMEFKKSSTDLIKNIKLFEEWKQEIELNKRNEADFMRSQLKKLEEKYEEQGKIIDEKNHQLAEAKEFINGLRDDVEKNKIELEAWKKDTELKLNNKNDQSWIWESA